MKQGNNIVLVGMPGCGKTTIGYALSSRLGFKFLDSDELIIQKEGRAISEIFKTQGEKYFRTLETETIKSLIGSSNIVLSTGGGILNFDSINLPILNEIGMVCFLDVLPDLIFDRIKGDTTRPLLQTNNPKDALFELYDSRIAKYKKADYIINAAGGVQEITDEIIEIYEKNHGQN